MSNQFTVRVPASSANIGGAFDTAGIALSLYLELQITYDTLSDTKIIIFAEGEGADQIELDDSNLVVHAMLYLISRHQYKSPQDQDCHYHSLLKGSLTLKIINSIPLSRCLGSSASAIVAGVVAANQLMNYQLTKEQLMSYILELEGHPDNVGASLYGGFVVGYCSDGAPSNRIIQLPWNPKLKAVCVIPEFQLSTKLARSVLPETYSRADVVYNLQRVATLVALLSSQDQNHVTQEQAETLNIVLQDKLHQPYRMHLIPGMAEMIDPKQFNNHLKWPGLCGVVLRGAGPTIMALCFDNYQEIGLQMQQIFKKQVSTQHTEGITSSVLVLDVVQEGAKVISD